jgi:hypothetical protein
MRYLSPSLVAAQQALSHTPVVKVLARNRIRGQVKLNWERLYTGSEDNFYHALAVCGNGNLIRVRITPPSDGRKLYRQTVMNPGPSSNFSNWTYTNQYNCIAIAATSLAGVVSILWVNTNREIRRIVSNDNGSSWGSTELIDHTPTTAVNGLAAAYKPNGDLALFFIDQTTLYIKKFIGGTWQNKSAWDKNTGDLSGVSVIYDRDWDLLVTGKETSGDFKLWSLVYGDGGCFPVDNWSGFCVIDSGPADGLFQYGSPCIYKTDDFHCFFVENYSGKQSYTRVFQSCLVTDTDYSRGLWQEQVPEDISAPFGLSAGYSITDNCCWLSNSNGVWKAGIISQVLDISPDIISLKLDMGERQGILTVEIGNQNGRYTVLPSPLQLGCQLEFSPGYLTSAGSETSDGMSFILSSIEYGNKEGRAYVILKADDAWKQLRAWKASDQFRWNRTGQEKSVRDIMAFVLARAGFGLQIQTQSTFISTYYPDFTIHPGNTGDVLVERLLSLTSDVLFFEAGNAYLVNPQSTDIPSYYYGTVHRIIEEACVDLIEEYNWVRIEGYDPNLDEEIISDLIDWTKIRVIGNRRIFISDHNLGNISQLQARGVAVLRKSDIASMSGALVIPVNCGHQLYDVIGISDPFGVIRTRRISGLQLLFDPARGRYIQKMILTGV